MAKTDPTGRVDLLAIRVLDRLVDTKAGIPEALVYQHFKRQIHSSIRRYLGPLRLSPQQLQNAMRTALAAAREKQVQQAQQGQGQAAGQARAGGGR
jgi:hypothetical protein